MRVNSVRDLEGLRPVLKDPDSSGPTVAYQVFIEIDEKPWVNKTVIAAGLYGAEYPKTFGHYHGKAVNETYHVVSGTGLLVLQKKHFDQKMWVAEQVDEVLIISATAGDELIIAPEFGHSWSNIGKDELILFDNWSSGHTPEDYYFIDKLHGLAYYLIDENGTPKAVPNPNYQNLPVPIWLSTTEFNKR